MNKIALLLALIPLVFLAACDNSVDTSAAPAQKALQVAKDTAADAAIANGRNIYEGTCAGCHATGVMNAPKVGNKADWAEPITDGIDTLVENAINGIGQMPPKGGNAKLSKEEIRAAVEYMIQQSR